MKTELIEKNGNTIASLTSDEKIIKDVQSALDLAMSVQYDTGTSRIAIPKETVVDEFFILSTGVAGEILQKFINYKIKIAIYGDYSTYTSKPLKYLIYECNKGKDIFFVSSKEQAIVCLSDD